MAFFRYRPQGTARVWLGGSVVVFVLLLLPGVLNLIAPEHVETPTPVILGMEKGDWSVPLENLSGGVTTCVPSVTDVFTNQWDCDEVVIDSTVISAGDAPNRTIRRALRGFGQGATDDSHTVQTIGNVRLLSTKYFVDQTAITLTGIGDHEDTAILVLVSGPDHRFYTDLVVANLVREDRSLHGEDVPLIDVHPHPRDARDHRQEDTA